MKFYLFFLKYDRSLYAFTTVKEYAEKFLNERNPNCFKVKEKKLKGEAEKIFMYTNKLLQLNKYPYQTGVGSNEYVELIATGKEDDKITYEVEAMENMVGEIDQILRQWPLKKKYEEVIDRMTQIHDNSGHITIDTLSLFVDVHKDTFIEREPIKPYEKSVWESQSDNMCLDTF